MNAHPIKIVVLALMLFALAGCTHEDMSMCQGLTLKFRYTLNQWGEDLLASQVRDLRLYLFDDSGMLCDIVRVSSEELSTTATKELALETGRYQIIAWGGSAEDVLMPDQYIETEMIDAAADRYLTPVVVGKTTLNDFYMMLAYKKLEERTEGDVTPTADRLNDLFYGALLELDYNKEKGMRTETIDLIKNTNSIKIKIKGLDYMNVTAATPYVLACNGRYRYDNTIDNDAHTVRYNPAAINIKDGHLDTEIKLLRLDRKFHTTSPILLKVRDSETGENIFAPIDVIALLSKVKDAEGNYLYGTQEDLDRQDEFLIEISIEADLGMNIRVNSWNIGSLKPGVE